MTIILKFEFKGSRNYIQGGDFVNRVDAYIREHVHGRLMRMKFSSFTRAQCELHFSIPGTNKRIVAEGSYVDPAGSSNLFWLSETDQPVTGRREYDEELIVGDAVIDGEKISLSSSTPFTLIEDVIALTKMLNYRLSPDVNGKWVFGQLKLTEPMPDTHTDILVNRTAILAGKFSNNVVSIDGRVIGDLRFIVARP